MDQCNDLYLNVIIQVGNKVVLISIEHTESKRTNDIKKGKKGAAKRNRVWDDVGGIVDDDGPSTLDYSATSGTDSEFAGAESLDDVQADAMGKRTKKGEITRADAQQTCWIRTEGRSRSA